MRTCYLWRAVDKLRCNGAVFIGLEPTTLDELVCNGSSTDGVFEVELVFPSRCKDQYILILLQQPIAKCIEVIECTNDHGIFLAGDVNGLGAVGRCQDHGFSCKLFLAFDVGDGAVAQVKPRDDFTIALSCSDVAFAFHSSAAVTDATGLMRSTPFSNAVQMAEVARNTSMTTTNSKFSRYSG